MLNTIIYYFVLELIIWLAKESIFLQMAGERT